jgi:O-antigen/teichoic acid export membrane protein
VTLSQGSTGPAGALAGRGHRFSLLLLAPLCAGGVLLAGPVLDLYGAAYASAGAQALRLLMLAAVPWSVVVITQAQLRIEHRFPAVTVLTGCLCAGALTLPVALAPALGGTGMALGWLVCVLAAAVLAARLARPAEAPRISR